MKEKMVRYSLDLANPQKLSAARRAELKALAERPESEIDFSDIPPLKEKFWQNAVRNPFLKHVKRKPDNTK